jgi:uncharacterized membrane protein YraQ (UPF0718 family)
MDNFFKQWSEAAYTTVGFFWMALWAFILGYVISSMIQIFVTEKRMQKTMGEDESKSVLLGTFFGGILYLLSQNYFPLFEGKTTYLVGASAGVSAIFVGVATYIPNYELKIRFIGYVKLWYLAAIWVGLDVLGLIGTNAGGNFAHLGGALFGFLYVYKASNKEITILDQLGNLFKRKEKPLKTVYKSKENKKAK